MIRTQTKQTLKLRFLAILLALALMWYSLNPVPTPITRRKRDDELPDEKKRSVEPHSMPATLPIASRAIRKVTEPLSSIEEDDDFEWPEFIDG